jgi:hypothetical protein
LISKNGVTKGKVPEGWRLSTRSSLRLDLETEAKLRQTQARTDQVYRMMGVLHPLEIRKNRFGSPDYSMETVLDPAIDKTLWSKKDDPEFLLPVLGGKPTGAPTGENVGSKAGSAHSGVDAGTKMGQAAIAGTGGDGGNNAEMQANESDRERMAENRRTDSYERRDAAAKQKLRWGDRTLAIEYLPGDVRHNRRMQGVYGYIHKHTGHDNQPLDFYGTPEFHQALCNGEQPVGKIFEIYQLRANSDDLLERKMLDETKIILGCNDAQAAIDLYLQHMPPEFMGLVNDLTPEELRHYRYRRDEEEFREDAKSSSKTPTPDSSQSNTGGQKKTGYSPSQKRGKDGRWVETGAENRQEAKLTNKSKKAQIPQRSSLKKKSSELSSDELSQRQEYGSLMKRSREYTKDLRSDLKIAKTKQEQTIAFEKFDKKLKTQALSAAESKKLVDQIEFDEDLPKSSQKNANEFFQLSRGKGKETIEQVTNSIFGAYADKDNKEVSLTDKPTKEEVFHEMAHHLEFNDDRVRQAANEWLNVREKDISTEQKVKLLQKSKSVETSEPEKYVNEFRYGKFIDTYVGRKYDDGSTEVVSTGMEYFAQPKSMQRLYEKDRSHFEFIVGVLTIND